MSKVSIDRIKKTIVERKDLSVSKKMKLLRKIDEQVAAVGRQAFASAAKSLGPKGVLKPTIAQKVKTSGSSFVNKAKVVTQPIVNKFNTAGKWTKRGVKAGVAGGVGYGVYKAGKISGRNEDVNVDEKDIDEGITGAAGGGALGHIAAKAAGVNPIAGAIAGGAAGHIGQKKLMKDNKDNSGNEGECKTPGLKIKSKGEGKGLAKGKGKGPIGKPSIEEMIRLTFIEAESKLNKK